MSYMAAYTIGADGVVAQRPSLKIQNSHSIAPVIWMSLRNKYVPGGDWSINPAPLFHPECFARLDPREQIVLLATSDGGWVAKKNFPVLRDALLWFRKEYPNQNSNVSTWAAWLDTIPETEAGACFHMTSVTENPWSIRETLNSAEDDPDDDWEDFQERPFDFTVDDKNAFDMRPIEVTGAKFG